MPQLVIQENTAAILVVQESGAALELPSQSEAVVFVVQEGAPGKDLSAEVDALTTQVNALTTELQNALMNLDLVTATDERDFLPSSRPLILSYQIDDDAVQAVDIASFGPSGIVGVSIETRDGTRAQGPSGDFRADAGDPSIDNISLDLTAVALTTGALSGTTGTDGKFTISAGGDGNLYLENRTGAGRVVDLFVKAGKA